VAVLGDEPMKIDPRLNDSENDSHQLEYARVPPKRQRRWRFMGDWLTAVLVILTVCVVILGLIYWVLTRYGITGPGGGGP